MEQDDYDRDPELLSRKIPKFHPILDSIVSSSSQAPLEWNEILRNKGEVSKIIHAYISKSLPTLFEPSDDPKTLLSPNHNEEEVLIKKYLVTPLNQFILLGTPFENQNLSQFIESVENNEEELCGHVFKPGEPTYACRDCGKDPTCVLCCDCFKHSEHINHRYKMNCSSGGGFCDCGDTEAWKKDARCSQHEAPSQKSENFDYPEVTLRIQGVIEAILALSDASKDPCSSESDGICDRADLKQKFCVIVHNDESHTFEIVIRALERTLRIPKQLATEFAVQVDRDGRSIVMTGTEEACLAAKASIEEYTLQTAAHRFSPAVPVKVEICSAYKAAYQYCTSFLLSWMDKYLKISKEFRRVFAELFLKEKVIDSFENRLKYLFSKELTFWKSLRVQWHSIFMNAFFKEYEIRLQFATNFVEAYNYIADSLEGDEDDYVFAFASLSVQIFTVTTIAKHLLTHSDVISVIMRNITADSYPWIREKGLGRASANSLKITIHCLLDLKYLLTSASCPNLGEEKFLIDFKCGIDSFIRFCNRITGMIPMYRQLGDHVEYELDWLNCFNLHFKLYPVIQLLYDWCSDLNSSYSWELLTFMTERSMSLGIEYGTGFLSSHLLIAGHTAEVINYKISSSEVSLYIVLHRFLAGLFLTIFWRAPQKSPSQIESLTGDGTQMKLLMEPALRVFTLIAQRWAGMWNRNGQSLFHQVHHYFTPLYRPYMFEKDLTMLQLAASKMDANSFIINIANRFSVVDWLSSEIEKPFVGQEGEEDPLHSIVLLLEEFLTLILNIISGRYHLPLMPLSEDMKVLSMKKDMIQALAIKPMLFSQIQKHTVPDLTYEIEVEEDLLSEVATAKDSQKGIIYHLKPEYYSWYDCFYYRYQRDDMDKAEVSQRARLREAKLPQVFPPPDLPKLNSYFRGIGNLLKSDVLLHIISTNFERATLPYSRSFSEGQFRRALHLIGYGLKEEKMMRESEDGESFNFIEQSEKHKIFELLRRILENEKARSEKFMINWILSYYNEMKGLSLDSESLVEMTDDSDRIRKERAAVARAKAIASMNKQQSTFRAINAEMLDFESEENELERDNTLSINNKCLGYSRSAPEIVFEDNACIMCKDSKATTDNVFIVPGFAQVSRVLNENRTVKIDDEPTCPVARGLEGTYVNSCGHIMHQSCWFKHCKRLETRDRLRPDMVPTLKSHYPCPMCDANANITLPVFQSLVSIQKDTGAKASDPNIHFLNFLNLMNIINDHHVRTRQTSENESTEEVLPHWETATRNDLLEISLKNGRSTGLLEFESILDKFWPTSVSKEESRKFSAQHELLETKLMLSCNKINTKYPPINITELSSESNDALNRIRSLLLSLAYTLTSIDVSCTELNIPLFGPNVPSRIQLTINHLVRSSAAAPSIDIHHKKGCQILGILVLKLLSRTWHSELKADCILPYKLDTTSLLILATFSFPYLLVDTNDNDQSNCPLPSGSLMDYFILKWIITLHLVQVIKQRGEQKTIFNSNETVERSDFNKNNLPELKYRSFATHFQRILNLDMEKFDIVDWDTVSDSLSDDIKPFVRCVTKFYETLTGVPPTFSSPFPLVEEMLAYLGVPTKVYEYFNETDHVLLFKEFGLVSTHKMTGQELCLLGKGEISLEIPVLYPRKIPPLIELPKDYLTLINSVASYVCPKDLLRPSSLVPSKKNPTMCLICGAVICSKTTCCMRSNMGPCAYHIAKKCGNGVGIFIRIRDCKAFIMSCLGNEVVVGAYVPPPYVDSNGETDVGLTRGNRLTLSEDKLSYFRKIWITHMVHEEVMRMSENDPGLLNLNYHRTGWFLV